MVSALPATVDLRFYRGDSWQQQFRLLEADVPVDLTGATAAAWAVNGRAPAHELTVTIGPDPGVITLAPPAAGLEAGHYRYDLEIADATTRITTWIAGRLDIDQDITNG